MAGRVELLGRLHAVRPALHAYNKVQVNEEGRVLRIVNSPGAMQVHLLLPEKATFAQTDRYEPEPESIAGQWSNTWHLTASTAAPSRHARFLAVLLPYRQGREATLPRVELLQGDGAMGVRLKAPDGTEDLVAFRTDWDAETVACAGIKSAGRVFAEGKDGKGKVVRRFDCSRE